MRDFFYLIMMNEGFPHNLVEWDIINGIDGVAVCCDPAVALQFNNPEDAFRYAEIMGLDYSEFTVQVQFPG